MRFTKGHRASISAVPHITEKIRLKGAQRVVRWSQHTGEVELRRIPPPEDREQDLVIEYPVVIIKILNFDNDQLSESSCTRIAGSGDAATWVTDTFHITKLLSKTRYIKDRCLTLCCRSWGRRRIIITNEIIAFAFVGKEDQVDCIPFAEIELVSKWQDEAISGVSNLLDADACNFQHQTLTALHIATTANGYNSGRHYYLSAQSVADRDHLIETLQHNATVARKRAEAITLFQKVQLAVRRHYDSRAVQYFLAGLIISVKQR